MNALIEMIKQLILKPKQTWQDIQSDSLTTQDILKKYLILAVSIPAAATFVGRWIVGIRIPFYGVHRLSFFASLFTAVLEYSLILIGIWGAGKVIQFLAEKFESSTHEINAYKLIVFSFLPYLAAGIIYLIPSLGTLVALMGLYCLFIFYLGIPVIMETPEERVLPFSIVSILVVLIIYFIISVITGTIIDHFGPEFPRL